MTGGRGSPPGSGSAAAPDPVDLDAFEARFAAAVLAWPTSTREAEWWCGTTARLTGPEVFTRWHAEDGVDPYVLTVDGEAVGYGELWLDDDPAELELARLIIDPARRGRGRGRLLVERLVARAAARGAERVSLRVRPENAAALACYAATGFRRVSAADEAEFNRGQPHAYVWMQRPAAPAPAR